MKTPLIYNVAIVLGTIPCVLIYNIAYSSLPALVRECTEFHTLYLCILFKILGIEPNDIHSGTEYIDMEDEPNIETLHVLYSCPVWI